tara:strand:- start:419 stop:826 length:408 start_codon:yes stop_codon:yes gene_type:complete
MQFETSSLVNKNSFIEKEFNDRNEFLQTISNNTNKISLFKFTATWCKPCQKIKNDVNRMVSYLKDHIVCYELDIDENFDVYAFLKSKKMLNGVPSVLIYYPTNNSYVSDLSLCGSDLNNYKNLFLQINNYKINTH